MKLLCRYVQSRSDAQLRKVSHEFDTSPCTPEDVTKGNKPIVPCGLIAWSLFNDTYAISRKNGPLEISKKNIAWGGDIHTKFGTHVYPKNFQTSDLIGGGKLDESIPVSTLLPQNQSSILLVN